MRSSSPWPAEIIRAGNLGKDQIKEAAVAHGYKVDGRNIHATLVNLAKSGVVEEDNKGKFSSVTGAR